MAALIVLFGLAALRSFAADSGVEPPPRWWKGNLHTHSLWSDGDDFPEMIVDWYKQHGYDFLALSDHNVLSQGDHWINAVTNRGGANALAKYVRRFGAGWVEQREENGQPMVRLKPLNEFRGLFEEAQHFLLIQSEEITDFCGPTPIHLNATNVREPIKPKSGDTVLEVMQRDVNAVLEQRRQTGQPMFPHLNHPNFGWAVTAEDLMRVQGERFFEVYNGHPLTRNNGDATHVNTDRMWDIMLTQRLAILGMDPIAALAVDDSHSYHEQKPELSNPGRGWLMVRAAFLTPEPLIRAIEAGEFYATSGVRLKDVRRLKNRYELEIEPEPGVRYVTQFIGTRKGFDRSSSPVLSANGEALPVTRRYSDDIGKVLAEVPGIAASYHLKGDEIYVRAKIISSKIKENAGVAGEVERAWTQPLVTGVK